MLSPDQPRSRRARFERVRGAGAVGAAAVLLGVTAVAPLTVPHAEGVVVESEQGRTGGAGIQRITARAADEPVLDLSVPVLAAAAANSTPGETERASSTARYTLPQFIFSGVVNWGGYRFTYYSQQVLPGTGLAIPGRHVNEGGYVSDAEGFIVLAGDAPKGTVFATPFGHFGKIYDRGTSGNHLDVYIR